MPRRERRSVRWSIDHQRNLGDTERTYDAEAVCLRVRGDDAANRVCPMH